jgi:hypothetical protein
MLTASCSPSATTTFGEEPMSRSNNSRKGSTNKHGKRHAQCGDKNCEYCARNFHHATKKGKVNAE